MFRPGICMFAKTTSASCPGSAACFQFMPNTTTFFYHRKRCLFSDYAYDAGCYCSISMFELGVCVCGGKQSTHCDACTTCVLDYICHRRLNLVRRRARAEPELEQKKNSGGKNRRGQILLYTRISVYNNNNIWTSPWFHTSSQTLEPFVLQESYGCTFGHLLGVCVCVEFFIIIWA